MYILSIFRVYSVYIQCICCVVSRDNLSILCLYSVLGLSIFPKRVINLRIQGHSDLFPLPLFIIQMGVLAVNFLISGLMILDFIEAKENFYVFCLMLFLIQGSIAFVRTIFYRAK